MNLYSIDVRLCATAYVQAETEEEALALVREAFDNTTAELPTGDGSVTVDGGDFGLMMPEVSLSPAVTFDPIPADADMSLVEEFEDESEEVN